MTRDDKNKRPAGGGRAQRLANMRSMETGSPSKASDQSSSISRRAAKSRPPIQTRVPIQGRPSAQDGSATQYGLSAQNRTAAQNRPATQNRPSAKGRPPAQNRPILQQGTVRRDFDREAARRRIEQRRRKEAIKKRRKAQKQREKQKTARSRKRRREKRVRAIAMVLVAFISFFFVWPHITEKAGEADEAQPAVATQPQSEKKESGKQESQMATDVRDTASEYLILVNKDHALQADYDPGDLVDGKPAVSDASKYQQLRKPAAAAFKKLAAAAAKKGHIIKITSGYRPYAYQKQIFERYVSKDGEYSAEQYSAEPGHSEHQTGLAADVSSPSVNYRLVQAYGSTEEGKWLAKNAHKYGFIIRFLDGKEDITGYQYEPWHIRYVGKEAAKEIYKQKLTLEEYLGQA